MCRLYANNTQFYVKTWASLHFGACWGWGNPATNPPWVLKGNRRATYEWERLSHQEVSFSWISYENWACVHVLLLYSHSVVSDSLQSHGRHAARWAHIWWPQITTLARRRNPESLGGADRERCTRGAGQRFSKQIYPNQRLHLLPLRAPTHPSSWGCPTHHGLLCPCENPSFHCAEIHLFIHSFTRSYWAPTVCQAVFSAPDPEQRTQ